ncbi:uncharacterized protein LOC129778569 [Toxorhynchites rutilus septentrionalis]|uniref:uncharacterized protein LOC129778569 n=1 Tax=Toxorhynchites rutilus septentrionalis TaxID=329112 RepID=UPI00247AAB2A|nr:uncharacterized protein LOC129778569 [Toxorhynchites rutilus septentrionalis]
MPGEAWPRTALEILLKLYKEHQILYDMRHPKYYNKIERQKALINMIDLIEDHRPGTNVNDVIRKIQTMRTQFGQELGKVRRAKAKGKEHVPTIWWYKYLSFLRSHVKRRSSVDDNDKDDYNSSTTQHSDAEYENYAEETYEQYELENDGSSEVVYEIQASTPANGIKTDFSGETKLMLKHEAGTASSPTNGSSKETIYEITNNNTLVSKRKIEVISTEELPPLEKMPRKEGTTEGDISPTSTSKKTEMFEITVESDRARSIGKFVSSQIASIKNDYLFYSTQMEVLEIINKAQLKQLQIDKDSKK